MLDPDGHLIEWGESIACFVSPLHDSGMSAAAVAKRTDLALSEVERILAARAR